MRIFIRSLFFSGIVLLSAGCSTSPGHYLDAYYGQPNLLKGSWVYADPQNGPVVLTFHKDRTFELDGDGDGKKDIGGTYELFENRVTFKEEYPQQMTQCTQWGYYNYAVEHANLNFTVMADQCDPRELVLSQPFVRLRNK